MKAKEIVEFLDRELRIAEIEDLSLNGLQVEGKKEINRVGFAVGSVLANLAKKMGLAAISFEGMIK